MIVHDGSNFSIGTVVSDERCFDFHLLDEVFMLLWVVHNIFIGFWQLVKGKRR